MCVQEYLPVCRIAIVATYWPCSEAVETRTRIVFAVPPNLTIIYHSPSLQHRDEDLVLDRVRSLIACCA